MHSFKRSISFFMGLNRCQLSLRLLIHLYISLTAVLRLTQEYFLCTPAARIKMGGGGNRAGP